ncbi:MAG TPA: PP2C family protein-serine/threonine phosphatase [Thermoanaerobaculaceae bacterium]|nr:PP2C family protein-serine/threonine phosphatase [Thermoanaerobaculaceae bacterium]HRS15985.1 PP2C family protein-serine/threonine phosphatase [Thermoanaerobaculaceae bacterium]
MSNRKRTRRQVAAPVSTPKSLFRRVERTLGLIQQAEDLLGTIRNVAQYMVSNFRDELGIWGGRIYRLDEDAYELVQVFGGASDQPLGTRVPRDYAGIQDTLDSGLVVMERRAPELDAVLESRLGTGERFAAIAVAEGDYIISFDVSPRLGSVEDLQSSLNIVRLAINQKLQQERFAGILEDARRIQSSILPKRSPRYGDFDIAGDSRPAEVVGGDFYDFIPITPEMCDLAIADASGHGLPAALQVRDVYMGLRMGLTRDFKVSRTVERLNAIINRSKLTSKFVSLFLAELETSGNLIYVNAGHVYPFILHADRSVEYLREGGMVLGPSPDARYLRGFAHLEPGSMLVLYTDGITECRHHRTDQEFELRRLQALLRRYAHRPATEIVSIVFEAVSRFSGSATPEDDQTLVIVRRPAPTPPAA